MMTLNNESEELNMHRIEKFGISQIFEAFLSSCWLGVRKPLRRCYHRALGIAHAKPTASLFIDDRQQNLISASTLGMNVLHFTSAVQLRSDLSAFSISNFPEHKQCAGDDRLGRRGGNMSERR